MDAVSNMELKKGLSKPERVKKPSAKKELKTTPIYYRLFKPPQNVAEETNPIDFDDPADSAI